MRGSQQNSSQHLLTGTRSYSEYPVSRTHTTSQNPDGSTHTPSHYLAISLPSQASILPSSPYQQPRQQPRTRTLSVKKNKDGTKEVTVETSVMVSCTFQQEGCDDRHPQPDGHKAGHGLACCSCLQSLPSLQVGECGCLACSSCLGQQVGPGYCNNCMTSVRYTGLDKIIRFPDKGQMSQLFMTTREREGMGMKQFYNKVLKEEKEFKIVDRILTKQEAAYARKNKQDKEELDRTVKEEEELEKKIKAKSAVITDLERSIRTRSSLHLFQHEPRSEIQQEGRLQIQHEVMKEVQHQVVRQFQYHDMPSTSQQMQLHHEAVQGVRQQELHMMRPQIQHEERLQIQYEAMKEVQQQVSPRIQHEAKQQVVHEAVEKEQHMARHQIKTVQQMQNEDNKKAKHMDDRSSYGSQPSRANRRDCSSTFPQMVAAPSTGLKSILKKRIAASSSRNQEDKQDEGHSEVNRGGDHCQEVTKLGVGFCGKDEANDLIEVASRAQKTDKIGEGVNDLSVKMLIEAGREYKTSDIDDEFKDKADIVVPGRKTSGSSLSEGDWKQMATPGKKRGSIDENKDYYKASCTGERRLRDTLKKGEAEKAVQQVCVGRGEGTRRDCNEPVARGMVKDKIDTTRKNKKTEGSIQKSKRKIESSDTKSGLVSAVQWMDRAVRGKTEDTASSKDKVKISRGMNLDSVRENCKQSDKKVCRRKYPRLMAGKLCLLSL